MAKFGPVIQIGESEAEEKPKFASLKKDQLIESISLDEALQLFKLPRLVGSYEGEEINAGIGKFGPYVRHNNKFYSLGKDGDALSVTLEEAIETIEAKRKEDASRVIKTFEENPEFQILKGKWGPYLKAGRKNVRLPKEKKPEELTFAECEELAKNAPEKGGRFKRGKK
jgi:DNA topoisomerase-1